VLKICFNLAHLWLGTTAAILLFRAILGGADPLGPAGWAATLVASVGSDVLSLTMIATAISLSTGRPPERRLFWSGSSASFFNAALALVVTTVLWLRPQAAWLPLVLVGML